MKSDKKKPYLAWKQQDFVDNNQEIPDSLLQDDFHTEGELMTDEEIVQWILDTEKTFSIIKEQDENEFEVLRQDYKNDLEYLVELGKIDNKVVDEILDKKNFEF